jgi:hypothetical protein
MRDKVTKITDEIGKLLDLQSELFKKGNVHKLAPEELNEYHSRRERIRQLCSELSDLPN